MTVENARPRPLAIMDDKTAPQGVAGAPNESALLSLMERTGYQMIQENGQRKYGGPPPVWEGPAPLRGCEIFVGKIPRDCYEDELVPIFEKMGKIYELRLMMDFSGSNRGYAFVMYTNKQDALKAVRELNNFELRKGRLLGVCMSVDNCRLFVGGIPKTKTKEEILIEMRKVTEGVVDVIVYPSAVDKSKNRGFAFVEFESHRAAAMARRKLIPGRIQLWGHQIAVDWAEPEQDVDEEIMSKVKILYVRNLMLSTTEETIHQVFSKAVDSENPIERVKKIRDFAFVHYKHREDALRALSNLNGHILEGSCIEVVLAKPVDKNDYMRYTRGKTASPQSELKDEEDDHVGLLSCIQAYGYDIPYSPALYGQMYAPQAAGRGFQSRTAVGIRGSLRGRGRGAAGSRGAGSRGGYVQSYARGYRRYTPEVLEEVCQKNGWGSPVYQLHSTMTRDGSGDVQLFLFKITIPALPSQPFQPNKLCRTVEEAKMFAAEYALSQLGIPYDSSEVALGPSSPYQGRPIGPAYLANGVARGADITYASSMPPVVTSASYVVAPGKMPPQMPAEYYETYHQPAYPGAQPPPPAQLY